MTRTVDRVMAEARAASFTKRSIKATSKAALLRLALSMLDMTTLEGKDTPEKVRGLCQKAVRPFERDEEVLGERLPSCAAVCVYPSMVAVAREELGKCPTGSCGTGVPPVQGATGDQHRRDSCATGVNDANVESREKHRRDACATGAIGTTVKIAAVATGFPSGQYSLGVRLRDVREAVEAGADEIDMVINRGAFLAGRYDEVAREIREVVAACGSAHLKVILETGELETLDNVRRASDLAIEQIRDGDFIKTSTGKVTPAATMPVTLVMLEAIRDEALRSGRLIGMKPAGGIRTAKQAVHYLVMVNETLTGVRMRNDQSGTWSNGPMGREAEAANPWLSPDLFRFGASTLCNDILRQLVKLKTGTYAAAYDFSEA
jgi:deoxyribose-phosphate aldolase